MEVAHAALVNKIDKLCFRIGDLEDELAGIKAKQGDAADIGGEGCKDNACAEAACGPDVEMHEQQAQHLAHESVQPAKSEAVNKQEETKAKSEAVNKQDETTMGANFVQQSAGAAGASCGEGKVQKARTSEATASGAGSETGEVKTIEFTMSEQEKCKQAWDKVYRLRDAFAAAEDEDKVVHLCHALTAAEDEALKFGKDALG